MGGQYFIWTVQDVSVGFFDVDASEEIINDETERAFNFCGQSAL